MAAEEMKLINHTQKIKVMKKKVSAKMQASIDRLEKKYGKLDKSFGSEKTPYNENFYCYCQLRSDILKSLAYTVLHNGEIHNL